ncbi:MAG TPA: hypothetical protein DD716_06555 [Thiomicrospira sp.]|jgi:ABC-type polysaccharide/polyol phosphate export permease|nr:hypothetical protein [Thiomicrospira sp.]
MKNFLTFVGVIVLTVAIPLVILLAIWLGFLPQSVQIGITMVALALSVTFIVGGTLFLIYSDIKTQRYAKVK